MDGSLFIGGNILSLIKKKNKFSGFKLLGENETFQLIFYVMVETLPTSWYSL